MLKALYLHTPYCKTNCSYCVYDSNLAPQKEIDDYFDNKLPLVISSKPFKELLANNSFEELYCGGGTPTIGSAEQWRNVLELIPLNQIKMLCTECSPPTVTSEHVRLWRDYQFDWVSMGVQSLRKEVLAKNNRASRSVGELERIIFDINEGGIISNIDLLCGIDKKDASDVAPFLEEVRTAMLLINPVSITIHVDINIATETLREIYKELLPGLRKMEDRYTCVNHSLTYSESDVLLNSEFRFMRDKKDFLFRQIAAGPTKLVENWTTWKISGDGIEHQTVEKESIREISDSKYSYRLCKKYRDALHLPFF